jgi:hypothetical protein
MRGAFIDERPWRAPLRDRSGEPAVTPELDAVAFARVRLGFEPDAHQAEVLRSTAKRGILNCSRQWGKSTVTAAKAVHRAFTRAGSLVLVASPGERQSREFLRKAADMVRKLKIRIRRDGDNAASLMFPNGSRIVGLPGTEATVRGFSAVSLILIDEAALVDNVMYQSLTPMLAVGDGDLWMMSTPRGQRGFFYDTWNAGGDEWHRVSVKATECERIPASFLDNERRGMDAAWFGQEYLCEFTVNGRDMYDRQIIEDSFEPEPMDLRNNRRR